MNLTAQQLANLRNDGRAAAQEGKPAAPAMSETWYALCDRLGPVSTENTATLRVAAAAFHTGYDLHTQGLWPLIDALEADGSHVYEVSSLGGNIRCVRVRHDNDSEWLVTGEEPDALTAARYHASDVDAVDSLDPITLDTDLTTDDVLALIRSERAGLTFAA
jgi:hypothetical protein